MVTITEHRSTRASLVDTRDRQEHKSRNSYANLEFEDFVVAERCGCTIVTAKNRISGRIEVYLLIKDK